MMNLLGLMRGVASVVALGLNLFSPLIATAQSERPDCDALYKRVTNQFNKPVNNIVEAGEKADSARAVIECYRDGPLGGARQDRVSWLLNSEAYALIQANRYTEAYQVVRLFIAEYASSDASTPTLRAQMWIRKGFLESKRGDVRAMRDAYAQVDSIGAGADPYLFTWTQIGSAQALLENGLFGDSFDLLNDLLGSLDDYAVPPGSDSAGEQDDANALLLDFEAMLRRTLAEVNLAFCENGDGRCAPVTGVENARRAAALFDRAGDRSHAGQSRIYEAQHTALLLKIDDAAALMKDVKMLADEMGDAPLWKEADDALKELFQNLKWDFIVAHDFDLEKAFKNRTVLVAATVGSASTILLMLLCIVAYFVTKGNRPQGLSIGWFNLPLAHNEGADRCAARLGEADAELAAKNEKLRREVTEHKRAEEQIRQLNANLKYRAEAVEAVNRKLDAFAYSVSNTLGAPLRGMEGFAVMLIEDYGSALPPEGLECAGTVRSNAREMATLLDELLAFSRFERRPLNKQPVDFAKLARQALAEVAVLDEHHAEIRIGDLPPCQADPVLLKQVLLNLLSNALKFSRDRDVPRIEVGAQQEEGETVYFVKDNGVGFDMQYADKMFGLFQRLHLAEEFEGTGTGLAIVQNIITRHGGRIWVEAAPEMGAGFYFTLGQLSSAA